MKRSDIQKGQTVIITQTWYANHGITEVLVMDVGNLFVLVKATGKSTPPPSREYTHRPDGSFWVHPCVLEAQAAPPVAVVQDGKVLATVQGLLEQRIDRLRGQDADVTPRKWETPGVHPIRSYRSWRRYKAAGASFAVIPFNSTSRTPEKTPVAVSVNVARQRAIIGLSLVAIIHAK